MIRQAVWAGRFYEGGDERLRRQITECFLSPLGPGRLPETPDQRAGNVVGIVAPHAGYIYSGPGAANAYCALAEDGVPEIAVVVGPKHHYGGWDIAIDPSDVWETPLGRVEVDAAVRQKIVDLCSFARIDPVAHRQEHSLEVQVPFLQFIAPDGISIVPIAVGLAPYSETHEIARELGRAIADAVRDRNAAIVASTDFTHFATEADARAEDALAIEAIRELDSERLLDVVSSRDISMCGVVPTAITIEACKALGAARAELLSYYSSGSVTGDRSSVVGYGALKIER